MSKVTIADLLSQNTELEELDNDMQSGKFANMRPADVLRQKRLQNQQERLEADPNSSVPYHKRKSASSMAASFGDPNNRQNQLNYLESEINKENPGNENSLYNRSGEVDENGQSTDTKSTIARGFIDDTALNAKKGLGDFIAGWGDIFQVAGAGIGAATQMGDFSELLLDGNMISRAMQEYGKDMSKANENYIPPEVQNAQFNAATFLNPQFWSTHGGQFIPQFTEILGTMGASALIRKGVQNAGKALLKDVIAESLEKSATKAVTKEAFEEGVKGGVKSAGKNQSWFRKNIIGDVVSTTEGRYIGGEAVNTVRGTGRGLAGGMTDQGKLTQGLGDIIQGVSGGAITNLTVSLRNAGEVFNTYKNVYKKDASGNPILDEQGNPVRQFSDEELGQMAADTFTTNMQYMLADIMSWGMTYGKGWEYLGSYTGKGLNAFGTNTIGKLAPQLFSKMTSPIVKNAAKLAGKATFEGIEETLQESYEEWSKMKGYFDTHGSLKGYQGNVSKDYDMNGFGPFSSGFWDYYKSKDSEAVRSISFALGGLAGGGFNISTLFDKQAETTNKFQNRAETLKKIFEKGTDLRGWQDKMIHDQMFELIIDNKGGLFQDFVQQLYNEDKIDEKDIVRYADIYARLSNEYNAIKDLNIPGKKAYMKNTADEALFQSKIQEATEIYQKNKSAIMDIIANLTEDEQDTESTNKEIEEKLKKEETLFKQKIQPLANALAKVKANKKNLILGKEATPVDYTIDIKYDENGNPDIQYVEVEKPQNNTDPSSPDNVDETLEPEEKFDEMFKNGWKSVKNIGKKAQEYVKSILGFANGEEETKESEKASSSIEEETNGAIEALANSFSTPEDIDTEISNIDTQISDLENNAPLSKEEQIADLEKSREKELQNAEVIPSDISLDPEENKKFQEKAKQETEAKKSEINSRYDTEIESVKNQPDVESNENKISELKKKSEDLKKAKEFKSKSNEQENSKSPKQKFINPNIIETDEEYDISKKDKDEFTKKGTVGSHVIAELARKKNAGEKIKGVHKKMYDTFKEDVDIEAENQIKELTEMLNNPDIDEETKSQIKEMLLSNRKTQISSEKNVKGLNEKAVVDKDEDWTDGRAKKEAVDKVISKVKSRISFNNSGNRNFSFISDMFRKSKNLVNRKDPDFGNNEMFAHTQSIQVSYALQKMYDNESLNVYAIEDVKRTVGVDALGYTLASQIYIDENLWNQDEIFMHEMSHIYYALNKDTAQVRTQLNYARQNKELVAKILSDYDDEVQFELAQKDKDGNTQIRSKRDILEDLYDILTQKEIDDFINDMVKKKLLIEIPLENQEVIMDELFAASLEGPLSEKYSKFFEDKINEEPKRRFFAKKFWGKVKEQGKKFSDKSERKLFLDTLSESDQNKYGDNMESLLAAFKNTKLTENVSAAGRASKTRQMNQKISNKLDEIDEQTKAERSKLLNGLLRSQFMKDNNINLEDIVDLVSFDEIFNTDRLQYTNKLMDVVKGFSSVYNKGISISNKISNGKWKSLNYVDPERLRYHIISIAKESHSGSDFIRRLGESEFDEVEKFNNWLDRRDDKNLMLQTLWWHEKNTSNITSFRTYINSSGNASLELNLNNREKTLQENVIDRIVQPFNPNITRENGDQRLIYDNLINAANRIYSGNFTNGDLYQVFKYFTTPEMDVTSIWNNDRINIGGKVIPLKSAIYSFVTGESGLIGNFKNKGTNGNPVFGLKGPEGQIKSSVRTLIQSIINENRKYTANLTTIHADGNQHPSRIVDNYLTRNFKQMKNDSMMLSKDQFYKKYSQINQSGAGSRSNNLLDFVYNKFKNGRDIDLIEFGGIENDFNEEKSVTLTDNDAASDRLNQFVVYLKSSGKKSYLMDLGRFSDSSRAYFMEVPKTETENVVKFENGKFVFSNKSVLDNIYNTHKALGYEGSYSDFKNLIEDSIRDNSEFIENNLSVLKSDNSSNNPISKFLTKDGKLTTEGKLKVANFEVNNIINGTNFNEIFFPSFRFQTNSGENEALKRAKSGLSPGFSFPNLQIENIYVNDVKIDGFTATDSAFYILEKHANKFTGAGGTIMPLGNAFKFLQTGVERYNENWNGKNIYNKGYATILNDEVVAKNPQLKGVYELLKRRDEKYIAENGQDSDNFLDNTPAHLPIIIANSSNKNKLNGIPESYDLNLMDIDMINDMTELGTTSEIDAILDKMYYKDDVFTGMSGENFVIQQVMDIDKSEINSPIQFIKSLSTNMMIHNNQEEILRILNDIKNLSQEQIDRGFDIIMNGDPADVRDFFDSIIDEDKIDQSQLAAFKVDKLSLKTPYLRELVKNTFANYVKKNGLKLKTPGGILREKPTLIKKQYRTSSDLNATSGSSELSFYRENSDGTFSPGEAVIPNKMLDGSKKKNPIRARKYFTEGDVESNLIEAKKEARIRGTKVGKVFDEDDNHIGYYAAGDNILATRVPSHGQQSTGLFEVVDFTGEDGNNIQIPNEFKKIIGSDNDGDQIFVQHKGRGTKSWNSIFDRIEKFYLNPQTQIELNQSIEFEDQAKTAIKEVEKVYGAQEKSFVLPFSSKGREIAFKDTLISKGNVGIAADLHTTLRMLSSYGVNLNKPITINGKTVDRFYDSEKESITINSAKLFNIILDNSKWGFADKLGVNTNTINIAMVLTNLGYDLTDVAMVLNHPLVKEFAELKNKNSGIFNRDEKEKVYDSLLKNEKFKLASNSKKPIDIDTANPAANAQSIFDLIRFVDSMTSNELKSVGNVLSSHNTMSVNPFEIDEMITNFNNVMDNNENKNLTFNENFKNNPIVQNYLETLQKNKQIQQKMDPSFSEGIADVYKEIIGLSGKEFSAKEHKAISQAINLFHTSQLLGLNNINKEEFELLTKNGSDRNIFDRLKSYTDQMNKVIVERNDSNPLMSKTALDVSLLFTKGLNFNFGGNSKYISVNSEFHNGMIDDELRQQMINEFNQMPIELRNDLLLYDLMKNGWAGPNSLFPLFNQEIKMRVSINSNILSSNGKSQLNTLKNRIIRNNPKLFRQYDNALKFNNDGSFNIDKTVSSKNPSLMSAFEKGKPFIFRTQDKSGKIRLVKFNGFNDAEFGELINNRSNSGSLEFYNHLLGKVNEKIVIDTKGSISSNPNLDYITIPHVTEDFPTDTYDALKEIENRISSGNISSSERGRAKKVGPKSDYYNFYNTMNRSELDEVMNYPENYEESRKEENWKRYLQEKQKADNLKTSINQETVKSMSYEKLLDLFSSEKSLSEKYGNQFDNDKGLSWRNKFAYAEVMRPVLLEIAQREATEQLKSLNAGSDKYGVKLKPLGEDISVIDKWMMSNNIPSSHPAVQSVVKKIEVQYKTFLNEKSKYVGAINNATDALYQEKFGYKVNDRSFMDGLKHLWNQLTSNKEDFYNQLYGSLIVKEQMVNNNGVEFTNIRYKNEEEIQLGLASGLISPAQHNFYKATKAITDEMIKFTGAKKREGYIPHTAPSTLEAFSRRGLLGVLVNSKTLNENIYDVKMNAKNPITGKMVQGVLFKQIEDWYNALSRSNTKFKDSTEFTKLKYKAIDLHKKGINEDGTPIRFSNIEMGTAMGDVFVDRFSKGRSILSADFPSMDLNKAFNDYVHSSLFTHGNDKFQGFKKLLPVIDGVLAQLDRDENKNMAENVEKIWKEYFLKGAKQHNLQNFKALEAVGISTDSVIDYITKGSLIYWLGWKGLAIGGGAYAIGNVLAGKYKNIINQGGNAWIKGEKRFWLGKSGKFDIKDPFKGIRDANEILKNAGFMDINIYDDIAVEKKNGIEQTLTAMALMPMSKSEHWIQGAHFLGMLNDEEWETLKNGGKLPEERTAQIEDEIKLSHGKGYQPTDQRMIQMYSWGRAMMQFSRWIPTSFYDKFAQEDINRYGQYYVGSYRKVYKTVQKAVDGSWSYSNFKAYRDSLEAPERRRLDAGLAGFGLSALLLGANSAFNINAFDKLVSDENMFADFDKLQNRLIPPAINIANNILK